MGASPTEVEQHRRSDEETRRQRGASLEPKRVATVIKVREVLEVYHAHPPVGRFPFRRLVGVHGSGSCRDQDERYAKGIRRVNARTRPPCIALIAQSASSFSACPAAS